MDARAKFQAWYTSMLDASRESRLSRTRNRNTSESRIPPAPAASDTSRRKITAERLQWAQWVVEQYDTSVREVATRLGVTPQTLRRYLRADGTLRDAGRELIDGANTSSSTQQHGQTTTAQTRPTPIDTIPGLDPPPPRRPKHGKRKVTAERLRWAQRAKREHNLSLRDVARALDVHKMTIGTYLRGDASLRDKGRELVESADANSGKDDTTSRRLPDALPAPPPVPDSGRRKVTATRLRWAQTAIRDHDVSLRAVADALDVHEVTLFSYLASDGTLRQKGTQLVGDA